MTKGRERSALARRVRDEALAHRAWRRGAGETEGAYAARMLSVMLAIAARPEKTGRRGERPR